MLGNEMNSGRHAWLIDSIARRPWMIVLPVLIAPVAEECLFRGILLSRFLLAGWPRVGTLVISIWFAGLHGLAWGGEGMHWPEFGALFLMSIVLCEAYSRSRKLMVPILVHGLYNAVAVAMAVL